MPTEIRGIRKFPPLGTQSAQPDATAVDPLAPESIPDLKPLQAEERVPLLDAEPSPAAAEALGIAPQPTQDPRVKPPGKIMPLADLPNADYNAVQATKNRGTEETRLPDGSVVEYEPQIAEAPLLISDIVSLIRGAGTIARGLSGRARYAMGRIPRSHPDYIAGKGFMHGSDTPKPIIKEALSPTKSDWYALFGPGVYFTDNRRIAEGYARSKNGSWYLKPGSSRPRVYDARLVPKKILDVEESMPKDVGKLLDDLIKKYSERDPEGHIRKVVDAEAKRDAVHGIDTVESRYLAVREGFRSGYVDNSIPAETLWEFGYDFNRGLQDLGYDALTHTGGNRVGNGEIIHQVVVLLDPNHVWAQAGKPRTLQKWKGRLLPDFASTPKD